MTRITRFLAILLLTLLPVAALAQGFVASTLESSLSGPGRTVKITGFTGALSSKATMQDMTIADKDGVWLTLKGVTLDWSRAALLTGRVEVNELSADEIIVARKPLPGPASPPSAQASSFSLPDLPVSINIGSIQAKKVEIGAPVLGQAVVVSVDGKMSLAGGNGSADLAIERTDGTEGKITLNASYANKDGQLAVDLQTQEAAGGVLSTLMGIPGAPPLSLSVNGTGPIDNYTADIKLATDGQPRLAGQVKLAADQSSDPKSAAVTRHFSADLSGDIAPLFAPAYQDFFGTNLSLQVAGASQPDGTLDLSQLHVLSKGMAIDGQLRIGADGLPQLMNLTGHISAPSGHPVVLPIPGQPTEIQSADLSLGFDAAKGTGWQADLAVKGLKQAQIAAEALSLHGQGQIAQLPGAAGGAVNGTVTFSGDKVAPADAALARALGQSIQGLIQFDWKKGQPLSLPKIQLSGGTYSLNADATIDGLDSAMKVTSDLSAKITDLTPMSDLAGRPLSGAADLTAKLSAGLLDGSFDVNGDITGQNLTTGIAQLDGLLKGQSQIHLEAARDKTGTTLRAFRLKAATLAAQAHGTIGASDANLVATADFSDAKVLGPQYGGSAHVDATYVRQSGTDEVKLDLNGQDLKVGIDQLNGLLKGQSEIHVLAKRNAQEITLTRFDLSAANLTASAQGTIGIDPKVDSDISGKLAFTNLGAMGPKYAGSVTAAVDFAQKAGIGQLKVTADGADLKIGQPDADKLLRGKTTLSLAATRQATTGKITLQDLNLTNPQLSAKANGTQDGDKRTVNIDAKLANLGLFVPQFPGAASVKGTVVDTGKGYQLDLNATGPGALSTALKGTVAADFASADLTMKGGIETAIANPLLNPRSIRGPAKFDLALKGPLAPASLSGTIRLGPARLVDPSFGVAAEGVTADVRLAGGRATVDAGATIGGGRLTITGPVSLNAPYTGKLAIALNNVQLKNPELYDTRLSGKLSIDGPMTGGAKIAGQLRLGKTELRVPSAGLGGAAALPNLSFTGQPAAAAATRKRAGLGQTAKKPSKAPPSRPFGLDITVNAPNQIFVRGRGLDAELGGSVKLAGTTANIVPSGGFKLLRGQLSILGKTFQLDEATLQLEGQFVPYVRISASSENDGVTSTITIEGEATDPQISFTSSPQLPQEEVLSQLLFGRGLDKITPFQAAQLAAAVATLAGNGGDGIIGNLRKSFGLDNLDLSTDSTGATQLSAGKYISKRLYSEVSVGSAGTTEVHLNLDVTKSIKLSGTAGSDGDSGIGIYYDRDY